MQFIRLTTLQSSHGFVEAPYVIPGFDKLVLKLLFVVGVIVVTALAVGISSIVGLIRAVRRRRRRGHSTKAVVLAMIASLIAASWLLYWVGVDIYNRTNPLNALLGINVAICALPLLWLLAAVCANVNRPKSQ